jgi:hypothetical protein
MTLALERTTPETVYHTNFVRQSELRIPGVDAFGWGPAIFNQDGHAVGIITDMTTMDIPTAAREGAIQPPALAAKLALKYAA